MDGHSVVWKNTGTICLQAMPQYFYDFTNTINMPPNNSVSVKVLFYPNYLVLRKVKS